jgi:hypothetical protein
MTIVEYYREHYPEGKPWHELERSERREIRKARRDARPSRAEEFYHELYPTGKPWDELSASDRRSYKLQLWRRRLSNLVDTVEDIAEVIEVGRMLLRGR